MPDWAAIAVVVFAVAQGLTYPLISLLLENRGLSAALSGLNAAGFAAGMAVATFMVGPLTLAMRGDRLIIVALAGCSASLAAFAGTDTLWVWFVARFLLGVGVAVVFMLSEAWLATACPDRLRGRISGIYGAGMAGGFAAGPLAIPLFGTESGFAFALLAVYVALVAFAVAILTRRTRTRPEQTSTASLMRFLRGAPIRVLMVLAFGFADITAISAMPVYFIRVGYTEAFAAFSVTVLALPTALAQPLVGVLLDRLPRPLVVTGCGAIAAVTFLAVPMLQSQTAILVVFAIMGAASFGLYTCALTLLGEFYRGALLVAGSAVFSLAYALGSAGGSTATGLAMDVVSPGAGPVLAGLALLAFTIAFLFNRRWKAPGARPPEDGPTHRVR